VTARSHRQLSRHDASTNLANMSWSLAAPKTPGLESQISQLRNDHSTYIVVDDTGSLRVVHELHPDDAQAVLGRIGKSIVRLHEP
jgi:predicted transcriptional regulator